MINFDLNKYPDNLVPIPLCRELLDIGFKEPCIFHVHKNDKLPYSVKDLSFELQEESYEGFSSSSYLNLDKNCYRYENVFSVPDWHTALSWFRKHNIWGNVIPDSFAAVECDCEGADDFLTFTITDWRGEEYSTLGYGYFDNYQSAMCGLLKEMIKIFKENEKSKSL